MPLGCAMRQILLFCLSLGLVAQEPGDLQDLQKILDQPVAAASKRIQRLKEAPADMTVVSSADIASQGYRTLAEALERVLGFRVNRDRAYDGLGVRGLYVLGDQNTRVLILLDGHPLNSPAEVGSGKLGEDFGIPLGLVARIEIIRGPASSLYGNNAFLGMVNVVTREPATDKARGELIVSGSDRSLGSLDGQVGGPLGSARWQVIGSAMQRRGSATSFPARDLSSGNEDPMLAGPLPANLDREERQSAYLKVAGKDWSGVGYALSRTQFLSSAPFVSAVGSPLNLYRNRILFGDVRYEPTFGDVETLLRVFGDHNEFSDIQDNSTGRSSLAGIFREWDPDRSLGAEVQARFHATDKLLITVGGEYASHRYDGLAGTPGAPVRTRVDYYLGNNYLQLDWTPIDALSCVLGLQDSSWRVSQAQSSKGGQIADLDRRPMQGITPRAALIWLPTALDIVKLLYGGGYRNPTIFERYYDDGSNIVANPLLEPEHITTTQGIWVHVWSDGLQSQVSYSQSIWKHLIRSNPLPGDLSISLNDGGSIQGRSLEGELKGRWAGWDLYAQGGLYRWSQAGISLANVAGLQAALRVTRRWQDWSASAEARHVGKRENQASAASVPAATTLRLALRWEQPRVWLSAVIQDATQARPWNLVATEYDPITAMREDGRTLLLSAGLRF